MNKITASILLITSVFLLISQQSFAQSEGMMKWQGSQGWGEDTQYSRMYNPQTVEMQELYMIQLRRNFLLYQTSL
jgi:hypothetical protein